MLLNFKWTSETSSIQKKIGSCSQLVQHRPCLRALRNFLAEKKHWSAVPESFGAEDFSFRPVAKWLQGLQHTQVNVVYMYKCSIRIQKYMCLQARWIIDTTLRYDRTVWKSNPHLCQLPQTGLGQLWPFRACPTSPSSLFRKSRTCLVNGIWCPGGCDGSMPSKGSDSSTYRRAGHVTIKYHQMIRLQNFLFTHLNGNVSTESWIVLICIWSYLIQVLDLNPSNDDLHLMWFPVCSGVQRAWWSLLTCWVWSTQNTPKRLATVTEPIISCKKSI